VHRARVFAGYAGWSPDQLEAELETSDWIAEPARPDDLFGDPGDDLWADVLRRKGGPYRLVATMPFDPTLN
jgi:putative transcriptional regulator